MAKSYKTKEEAVVLLEEVIAKIYETARGRWTSVRDLSIGNLCIERGLSKNYAASIMSILEKRELVEVEGQLGGLRYKIDSNLTFDASYLAERTFIDFKEKRDSYKTKTSDLQPPKAKKVREEKYDPHTVITKRRSFRIPEEKLFFMPKNSNLIVECVIEGVQKQNDEYYHAVSFKNSDGESTTEHFVKIKDLFDTPEACAQRLIKNTIYLKTTKL